MTGSTLFPRRLFASIRRETPHVDASQRSIEAATLDAEGACQLLKTSTSGLSEDEARSRLNQYGSNILAADAQGGFGRILRHAVFNPLVMLLASLVLVSFVTGDNALRLMNRLNQQATKKACMRIPLYSSS